MNRCLAAVLVLAPLCLAQNTPQAIGAHFDKIYTMDKPPFETHPSGFLVESVRELKPGKALDVAMGQGRNAIFLAGKGWDVTGFDVSEKGLAVARAAAAKAGVRINIVQKSQQEFDFGKQQWDLIAMVYSWMPMEDAGFLRRVRDSLKPGGMVLVEQFNAPPGTGAKGPANALLKSFQDLRVVNYEDRFDVSDWGRVNARIGRIIALKD